MKFLNVKQFAEMKNCSRETVYKAAKSEKVNIDRSAGFPVIHLNDKNLSWNPQQIGRPKKEKIKYFMRSDS